MNRLGDVRRRTHRRCPRSGRWAPEAGSGTANAETAPGQSGLGAATPAAGRLTADRVPTGRSHAHEGARLQLPAGLGPLTEAERKAAAGSGAPAG